MKNPSTIEGSNIVKGPQHLGIFTVELKPKNVELVSSNNKNAFNLTGPLRGEA